MSRPRPNVDPAMQAWIDEQMKHFPPGCMDGAIRQLKAYERADREQAQRGRAAA
ncbi:hypothetical protein [Nocardia sp. N2S4-5]|uniref:hypothetical protein n=1 Tax=Nocardia sp. N2S4-5 TaxID=3351565 RepID=UPI0037D84552